MTERCLTKRKIGDERLQLFVWGEKDAWMTDERADTVKNYNKDQAGNFSDKSGTGTLGKIYCNQ